MREIKFRGRRSDGEWLYGDLMRVVDRTYIMPLDTTGSMDNYEVDPETVGQYTGLKDQHGKEIYEGDIVDVFAGEHHRGIWEYQKRFVVEYGCTQSMWEMGSCDQVEVIGNIYEHPEWIPEVIDHDQ